MRFTSFTGPILPLTERLKLVAMARKEVVSYYDLYGSTLAEVLNLLVQERIPFKLIFVETGFALEIEPTDIDYAARKIKQMTDRNRGLQYVPR